MKVSIITICYNNADTLEETILSVSNQTHPDIEYIIIDGQSTDGSDAIVQKHRDKVDVYVREPDAGIYDAINKGIGKASGDVVGLLHADDFYCHDQVIADVSQLMTRSQSDALYADCLYVDQHHTDRISRYWKSGEYVEGAFLKGWMPPHPTFFVRRDCYLRLGLYDTRFRSAGDYELMLRYVHKHGISVCYLPKVILCMRQGGTSNRSLCNRWRAHQEDRLAWKINDLKPGWFTLLRKPLSKLKQFFRGQCRRKNDRKR